MQHEISKYVKSIIKAKETEIKQLRLAYSILLPYKSSIKIKSPIKIKSSISPQKRYWDKLTKLQQKQRLAKMLKARRLKDVKN